MKIKLVLVMVLVLSVLLTGCGKKNNNDQTPTTVPTTAPTTAPTAAITLAPGDSTGIISPTTVPGTTDVVTTASIVNTEDAFLHAISPDGTWIIAILQDMKIDSDLVLDGEFKNGKQDAAGKDIIQRKIALYAQDENRVVTARYKLTAPKITIRSPQASIQKGIFVGDIYVDVDNFQLVDQEVDGNIYFTKQAYKDSFVMDATSKVTGKMELVK